MMQFFFDFLCVHHFSLDDLQQVTVLSKMFTDNTLTKNSLQISGTLSYLIFGTFTAKIFSPCPSYLPFDVFKVAWSMAELPFLVSVFV